MEPLDLVGIATDKRGAKHCVHDVGSRVAAASHPDAGDAVIRIDKDRDLSHPVSPVIWDTGGVWLYCPEIGYAHRHTSIPNLPLPVSHTLLHNPWYMNPSDTRILRDLAQTYAEYAAGEVMESRREKWRRHNTRVEKTYPFHIEDNGRFTKDLLPPLICEDEESRGLEARLRRAILYYEKIDDDRIIPDRFLVDWVTHTSPYCAELTFTHVDDGAGGNFGYETNKPIKDIDGDFHKITPRTITLDRDLTDRRAELASNAFAGLLPVEIGRASSLYSDGIANKAVHLLGMEALFLEMAMNPDAVHRLFAHFCDDNLALGRWEEEHGLLTHNNDGNQGYCSGSSQFGCEMPEAPGDGVRGLASTERCGYLEAQEATGISPDMFGEFFMPQFQRLAARFKMFKFGCCEPVHDLMPHLIKLPGLFKVSVTPWCDIRKLADRCPPDVIWSRKPVPLKLCDTEFDAEDFRAHLLETLEVGGEYFIEFIFRDTNRLTGAMSERLDEACRIVRDLTGHHEGSRATSGREVYTLRHLSKQPDRKK